MGECHGDRWIAVGGGNIGFVVAVGAIVEGVFKEVTVLIFLVSCGSLVLLRFQFQVKGKASK